MPPNAVVPTPRQVAYQEMALIGFIHFTVNTFTDREWGLGDENPGIFNPSELNVEQWVLTAKAAGMKQLILTAKHHDGFCLWPSKYTEHSVKNSPWKNGKGDLVEEFSRACRKHGLKVGFYLSPWDRNHPDYGKAAYLAYFRNQLKELLTNYGRVSEIWFDGANGGRGYYGGSNEIRKIDRKTYYGWPALFSLVKNLQPEILIFSDAGPDIRWIGNESGFAGESNWSTIDTTGMVPGEADTKYLNSGDPNGEHWVVGECDVSIRPGWFYHEKENRLVKTVPELVNIYYKSVGRNGVLLLNVPPDRRGLIHEIDAGRLREFGALLKKIFKRNLARDKPARASNYRNESTRFHPCLLLDGNPDTYWATDDEIKNASVEIDLQEPTSFNLILLQEYIPLGQRVTSFDLEAFLHNRWKIVARGTTIGYKRILKISPVKTRRIRLTINGANACIVLSALELYREPWVR